MKATVYIAIPIAVVSGWMFVANAKRADAAPVVRAEPVVHAAYDAGEIDRNIEFHKSRVRNDPRGAIGWAMLGEAWLERARESDLDSAAWEAETAARKSLAIRTRGNGRAFQCLVNSLLEQHRFRDALVAMDSYGVRNHQYVDALIEGGRYAEAEALIVKLVRSGDVTVGAAQARLASVRGDHARAIALFEGTEKVLLANPAVANKTLAWFEVKLGDELRAAGNDQAAEERYQHALTLYPRSYKATLALARLAADMGRWTEAEALAKRTQTIVDSLDARAILGDAARATGRLVEAKAAYAGCLEMYRSEVAKFAALGKGGPLRVRPIDRQFATFAASHRMFVAEALAPAKRDLANRPDPHAKQVLQQLTTERHG